MRSVAATLSAVLCVFLFACGGTEIIKDPAPIVWGNVTFKPQTIEKSSKQTVWNNVTVTAPRRKGTIAKVTIKSDETVVENIKLNDYSAVKQIFRGASGDYQTAAEIFFGGSSGSLKKLRGIPRFSLKAYEAQDQVFRDGKEQINVVSMKCGAVSPASLNDFEAKNISFRQPQEPEIKVASMSFDKIAIPEDMDSHPEKLVLDDFRVRDLEVPLLNIKVDKVDVNYSGQKLDFGVLGVSVPGPVLAQLGLPDVTKTVTGSLKGEGQVKNSILNAKANLDLPDFVDVSADIQGNLNALEPENLNFSIKDRGLVNILPDEVKVQLLMGALLVPNAQQAIAGFLAKPKQTITGAVTFRSGRPDIQIKLK